MMKIVIVDDEKNVRIVIKKLLALVSTDYEVVGEAASIIEAKTVILNTDPDLVLLDIELEDGTGFDLLKQIDKPDFKLIFITAFNEYAIRAFKFNALDYLLKPIDPEELKVAIDKVKSTLNSQNELNLLLDNFEKNKTLKFQNLVVKTTQQTYFLPINNILYFQSDGSYSKIVTLNKTILASKNLKHFQELVPEELFIRTHQSYLVNKEHVAGLKGNNIVLKNNVEIPISVRRKKDIKKMLN
ncbi:MAG: LytTR family DNA-binding domain-containing protein [Flavobacteriaceae bacterium]